MNQDEVNQVAAYKNLTKVIQSAADATYPELKLTAVRELNTLLSLESPPIDELIQNGILPILVDCLKESSHVNLQVEAAWALTNMTSGNSEQTIQVTGAHLFYNAVYIFQSFLGGGCWNCAIFSGIS